MTEDDQPSRPKRPWRKLTAAQVREIRRRYAAGGVTMAQLAAEYGVTHMAISYIVRRVTWDQLDP